MDEIEVEVRATPDGARVINARTGLIMQEDFEHGCMVCPVTGLGVPLSAIVEAVETSMQHLQAFLQTLREAQPAEEE